MKLRLRCRNRFAPGAAGRAMPANRQPMSLNQQPMHFGGAAVINKLRANRAAAFAPQNARRLYAAPLHLIFSTFSVEWHRFSVMNSDLCIAYYA